MAKTLDSSLIEKILKDTGRVEKRRRKLPARLTVLLVVAMSLYAKASLPEILNILVEGLRVHGAYVLGRCLPVKSALSQARQRLGIQPIVELFRAIARPIATQLHPWAFYKGFRLMALDGTSLDLPDTPDNERFFGRPEGGWKGKAAWPMATVVALIEVGTRITVDAFVGGYKTTEIQAAIRLMRSLEKGMLLLWDRYFVGYPLWKRVLARSTHLLGRIRKDMVFEPIKNLPDGSFLAKLYPSPQARRKDQRGIIVRLIEYGIADPAYPGSGEKYRLSTSLLDHERYPAKELIVLYHERWEVEIEFDEMKTHLVGKTPKLRSQKPLGCLQEIYGLLIAHIAVRSLMAEAAFKYNLDPDRLSFVGSLRVISRCIPRMQAAKTGLLPIFYEMMLDEIASCLNPPRRIRLNPRVVKQKIKKALPKRPEHYHYPQPKSAFHEAIYVLN